MAIPMEIERVSVETESAPGRSAATADADAFEREVLDVDSLAAANVISAEPNLAPRDGLGSDPFGAQGTSQGRGGASFFGVGGSGKTFAYVVDCSQSMRDDGKFEKACAELIRSIERLDPSQRFLIIFYNESAHPMEPAKPLQATPENLAEARDWIRYSTARGKTNPLEAMLMALSAEPDAIFLLSDGIFDAAIAVGIQQNNGSGSARIPIHTIAFRSREGEPIMRGIARHSGGKYRFVR